MLWILSYVATEWFQNFSHNCGFY